MSIPGTPADHSQERPLEPYGDASQDGQATPEPDIVSDALVIETRSEDSAKILCQMSDDELQRMRYVMGTPGDWAPPFQSDRSKRGAGRKRPQDGASGFSYQREGD